MDNVGIINETCKLAGIDRVSAKKIDTEDDKVWESIRDDTDLIFQVSGNFGSQTIKKIFSDMSQNRIFNEVDNFSRMDLFSFTNALLRPCGKSVYEDATNGIAHVTGIKEIDEELGSELGYPLFQETQMKFVMDFCGYSFLEADKLRKIISKKFGTRDQLPIIKKGFEEHGKKDLNLTDEQSEKIIEPFLQCILDATRYSFCRIHAYSYSYIGYICAYLRYYYPIEYLTACFNTWINKEDKTNEVVEYAKKIGVKILEPKFRHGKSRYSFDKENKAIYKGMKSIKYLNNECSEFLYSLRNNEYSSFSELLYDIAESKSLDSRQIEILIKLDFFSEFGNSRELLKVYQMFKSLKDGEAKSMKKEKVKEESPLYPIIKRNCRETAKTFMDLNTKNILMECEEYIKCMNIPDFCTKEKALAQKEYLGYINLMTGILNDRPKILILEKRQLISKKTNKPWAMAIEGQSIGSGKKTRYTIFYKNYSTEPFDELDTIFIEKWENRNGYFYISKYHKIFESA